MSRLFENVAEAYANRSTSLAINSLECIHIYHTSHLAV